MRDRRYLSSMALWITGRLGRTFSVALASVLLTASLGFLALFVFLYRAEIEHERTRLSDQTTLLLQAALENAMLKRDLLGLENIIERLGQQDGINSVFVLNPEGEVRFSSDPRRIGHRFNAVSEPGCRECHQPGAKAMGRSLFLETQEGSILRGVNPVLNREPCQQCHGPMAEHPVNGILVIDFDAAAIRQAALRSGAALAGAGALVAGGMALTLWWLLRRRVLDRLAVLDAANHAMGEGDLDARAHLDGEDEIARLAQGFNAMAATLQSQLAEIKDQGAFLQAMIDAVPDGLRVIDERGHIVTVNRTYRQQLGQTDATPGLETCYASSHGRSEPCVPTLVSCPLQILKAEPLPFKSVHQHRRADSSEIEVEVYAAPMRAAQRGQECFYVVESIRELAQDIRFSHEHKLSTIGLLAAGVAHEIRNPLASIRMAVQAVLLETGRTGEAADTFTRYLRLVDGQIDKCIDVTNRLLKLSAGAGAEKTLCDVNEAISETLSLVAWHAEDLGIDVRFTPGESVPRVLMVDGDLRMVLLNLVQNAFHAMPQGGRLVVTVTEVGETVSFRVADSGVGIRAEHQDRIFQPFFSHRADGEQGTGLGLAICKSIVDTVGGRIEVVSQPDQGACFTVSLPNAETAVLAKADP